MFSAERLRKGLGGGAGWDVGQLKTPHMVANEKEWVLSPLYPEC